MLFCVKETQRKESAREQLRAVKSAVTVETIETDETIETIVIVESAVTIGFFVTIFLLFYSRVLLGTLGAFESVEFISPEGGSLSGRAGGVCGRAWVVRWGGGSG